MTEADFISALRALPLHPGARGLQDDCAVLEIGDETLVITHDSMAEGTHFRSNADMADVAWKLVVSNLSDLAAKGAEPVGVLLSYSLGTDDARFLEGLHHALAEYSAPLLGGDTTASNGPRTFGMTAIGRALHSPVPARSGAKPGDGLFVTGTLGCAMLGFEGDANHLDAFNRPRPLLNEGREISPIASAMMDVSDGLLLDAYRLASASEVSLAINSGSVPVADTGRAEECLRWGDDYQLLFTLPAGVSPPVPAAQIGSVEPRGFAPLILDSHPIVNSEGLGYQHG